MSVLALKNISKVYHQGKQNELRALDDINIDIEKGEMIAVVGKSGAGKSTLLHIIGCLSKPTSGNYYVNGNEVDFHNQTELAYLRNKVLGNVLQDFGLIEYRNVVDNVSVPLIFNPDIKKKEVQKKCMEALKTVDMIKYSRQEAWSLSGGQKQRVAIARALVNEPQVILADEPTGSLDLQNTRIIMEIFQKLKQEGKTIVLVTHDMDIAKQCDRMVQIEDGKFLNTN